jgi:NADPH:quinone reductase-like Zn-dependent oxidoreductase
VSVCVCLVGGGVNSVVFLVSVRQGLTALYGLKSLGDVRKGHRVLVHSAAGGVGLFALAICQAVGATPVATVGSDSKVNPLLRMILLCWQRE